MFDCIRKQTNVIFFQSMKLLRVIAKQQRTTVHLVPKVHLEKQELEEMLDYQEHQVTTFDGFIGRIYN